MAIISRQWVSKYPSNHWALPQLDLSTMAHPSSLYPHPTIKVDAHGNGDHTWRSWTTPWVTKTCWRLYAVKGKTSNSKCSCLGISLLKLSQLPRILIVGAFHDDFWYQRFIPLWLKRVALIDLGVLNHFSRFGRSNSSPRGANWMSQSKFLEDESKFNNYV